MYVLKYGVKEGDCFVETLAIFSKSYYDEDTLVPL